MAYNPFDFFRRNQKLFFAGLTVMVMFMFVLSFGQGDFFDQASTWLGKWQTHGEVMAVIDGSKIKESQLQDVSAERQLANGYMLQAAEKGLAASEKVADADVKAAGPENQPTLSRLFDFIQQRRLRPVRSPEEAAAVRQTLAFLIEGTKEIEGKTGVKAEDAKAARSVRQFAAAVQADLFRRGLGERGESGLYFVNQPNRTARDQLDYLLWRKKADKLGIQFTRADVARLVDHEFPSVLSEDLTKLADTVAANAGRKTGELYEVLADEFRVRAAQAAVIGLGAVNNPSADPAAPAEERYEHFAEQTTATRYTFLTIPVEAYLPLVQGQPTEAELTRIFNDASGADPDPGSARPGLREPRKIGVQWVEVTGQEPYYQALAAKRTQMIPGVGGLLGGAAASTDELRSVGYDDYLKRQAEVTAYRLRARANPGRPSVGQDVMAVLGGGLAVDPRDDNVYPEMTRFNPKFASPDDQLLDAELFRFDLDDAIGGALQSAYFQGVTEFLDNPNNLDQILAGIEATRGQQ